MSVRIALRILILTVVAGVVSRTATAGPWGLGRGEWYSTVESGVFSTRSVYLDSGDRADAGVRFEQRAITAYSELGWKHGVLFFSLPTASRTLRVDAGPFSPTSATYTRTGFQDGSLGMRFPVRDGRRPIAVEMAWSGPLGYNRKPSAAGPPLGDGLQQLGLEIHVGSELGKRGFVQASVGRALRFLGAGGLGQAAFSFAQFTRDESRADLIAQRHSEKRVWSDRVTASADLGIWAGPSLLVGGRYRGFATLANGPLADDVNLHAAGPIALYRVDDRIDVYAGSWSTLAGRNALHYGQVYAGVAVHKTKLNRLQGFMGGKQSP